MISLNAWNEYWETEEMVEGYLGEIRIFSFDFTPPKWTPCYGQLLSIVGHEELFSVIGTTYGGDGWTTFGVPDMRGRIPMHRGQTPGHLPREQGELPGVETTTLSMDQIPSHNHIVQAAGYMATSVDPTNHIFAQPSLTSYATGEDMNRNYFGENFVQPEGWGDAHNNIMPCLVMKYFMCIQGVQPPSP